MRVLFFTRCSGSLENIWSETSRKRKKETWVSLGRSVCYSEGTAVLQNNQLPDFLLSQWLPTVKQAPNSTASNPSLDSLCDWTTTSALCCLHSHQSHEYSTWVTASLDATGSRLRADMHLLRESTTLFGIFTPPYLQNTIFFFQTSFSDHFFHEFSSFLKICTENREFHLQWFRYRIVIMSF